MYLDFPVEIPYDTYDPDLLGVYYVYDMTDNGEIRLARLSHSIPANTGVLVQGNSGSYRFPKVKGNVEELKWDNYLTGSAVQTTKSEVLKGYPKTAVILTFQKGASGYIGFYRYTGTVVPANKAFIIYDTASSSSSVNGFSIAGFGQVGDEFTGIRDIDAEETTGDWYTIQGMRLNGQPKQRGIYIHNGKTVVVR